MEPFGVNHGDNVLQKGWCCPKVIDFAFSDVHHTVRLQFNFDYVPTLVFDYLTLD
jgi:hypothetical protein